MKKKVIVIDVPEKIQESWQEIINLTSQLCKVPAALIMRLTCPDIEVFTSSQNPDNPYNPGDKEHFEGSGLYCERVIKTENKLLVPDALADEEWKNNPDVKLQMISYLGFPLFLPDRSPFGTICVLDRKRNEYSPVVEKLMLKFKNIIEYNLELIYLNQVLGDKNKGLSDYLMEIQAFRGIVPICSNCKAIKDREEKWRPVEHYLINHPKADFSHGMCPECMKKLYPKLDPCY